MNLKICLWNEYEHKMKYVWKIHIGFSVQTGPWIGLNVILYGSCDVFIFNSIDMGTDEREFETTSQKEA